jgi:hypothetical protein
MAGDVWISEGRLYGEVNGGVQEIEVAADVPELATSDPAKVPVSTSGGITTLDVARTVPDFARLTADSAAVNNSQTLVDVTGLSAPVAANAAYWVDSLILYNSTESTARISFGWTTPAGVSGKWMGLGVQTGATTETSTVRTQDWLWTQSVNLGADTGVDIGCILRGTLVTGGTAGTLQLQFAQATATVADTIVLAHSTIRVERLP